VRKYLVKIGINAAAIWVASAIVDGVHVTGHGTARTVLTLMVLGALFGVVNTVIKPVVKLLTLPFYFFSLGLIAFVVNALMLEIVSWLSGKLGISFTIDHFFWTAVAAAFVVTFVSMVLNIVVPDQD